MPVRFRKTLQEVLHEVRKLLTAQTGMSISVKRTSSSSLQANGNVESAVTPALAGAAFGALGRFA